MYSRFLPSLFAVALGAALLTACGGDDGGGGSGSGGSGDDSWHINNKQTRYQDVYFTDEQVTAGLDRMVQEVVVPRAERNGRDASGALCWMVVNEEGMLRQMMWCGPLVNPDGVDEWSAYPFATEGKESEGEEMRIVHAPMLRDTVGTRLAPSDQLRRPDGKEPPGGGGPGEAPQAAATPVPKEDCSVTGTIDYEGTKIDVGQADYVDIETTVKRNSLVAAGQPSEYIIDHRIRVWDDESDSGHRLNLSSNGPVDGPFQARSVSIDPYLQTREQMEQGLGSNQSLSAPVSGPGTFEMAGVDGARVVADASRETFSDPVVAAIDIEVTCR
ncbi:hypothetical protein [Nocardioides sp. AE5]|uniref:hypothetical protein n=1 Tax=Nocardioides sp. AE5 TaxID=2962573 RepID=UPI002880FF2C|nr:hypothetical protein [Nocardioides sp. AE5]MDT0201054.1 hypothetical protein [Nocardioides sp. AE5]